MAARPSGPREPRATSSGRVPPPAGSLHSRFTAAPLESLCADARYARAQALPLFEPSEPSEPRGAAAGIDNAGSAEESTEPLSNGHALPPGAAVSLPLRLQVRRARLSRLECEQAPPSRLPGSWPSRPPSSPRPTLPRPSSWRAGSRRRCCTARPERRPPPTSGHTPRPRDPPRGPRLVAILGRVVTPRAGSRPGASAAAAAARAAGRTAGAAEAGHHRGGAPHGGLVGDARDRGGRGGGGRRRPNARRAPRGDRPRGGVWVGPKLRARGAGGRGRGEAAGPVE